MGFSFIPTGAKRILSIGRDLVPIGREGGGRETLVDLWSDQFPFIFLEIEGFPRRASTTFQFQLECSCSILFYRQQASCLCMFQHMPHIAPHACHQKDNMYPRPQFLGYHVDPLLKKGGVYLEKPIGFPKSTPEKRPGTWSRG